MEVWKDAPDYEGFYQVSDAGRVKRIKRYRATPGIKKPTLGKNGYFVTWLWKHNTAKLLYVHRLVCAAFHGEPQPGHCCNHKDGNRLNNHPSNLEWMTLSQNECHAIAYLGKSNAGERNGQSKLTEEQVLEMRKLRDKGYTHQRLGNLFGVGRKTAGDIVNRKRWRHI